jgi:hypothetical protein
VYKYNNRVAHCEPCQWYHSSTYTFSQRKQQYTQKKIDSVDNGNQGRVGFRTKDYFHPTKTTSFKKVRSQNFAPSLSESKNYANKKEIDRGICRVSIVPPNLTSIIEDDEKETTITVQQPGRKDELLYQPLVGDYDEVLGYVLESFKDGRKNLLKEKSADVHECMRSFFLRHDSVIDCRENLLTFHQLVRDSSSKASTIPAFSDEKSEAEEFLSTSNMDTTSLPQKCQNESLTQKLIVSEALSTDKLTFNHTLAVALLNRAISICAKYGLRKPLRSLWEKTKELGCTDQKVIQNLLYVAVTYGTSAWDVESAATKKKRQITYQNSGSLSFTDVLNVDNDSNTVKNNNDISDDEIIFSHILDEIAIYHDLLHDPTEQTICIRIRMLVANGKIESAEATLQTNEEMAEKGLSNGLRLRAYKPVLQFYLDNSRVSEAMALYRRMQTMPLVVFDADTYVSLLEGVAKAGVFMTNAPPVERATQFGFVHSSGPGLFEQMVQEMAEEIVELPDNLEERLKDSLSWGEVNADGPVDVITDNRAQPAVSKSDRHTNSIAEYVSIDNLIGSCPLTGIKLQLFRLNEDQMDQISSNILDSSDKSREHWLKTSRSKNPNKQEGSEMTSSNELRSFINWLNTRTGKPYTAIIDGGNVGFFNQNLVGDFSYQQIKFVHDSLLQIGENPLVILPRKYGNNSFINKVGIKEHRQYLTKEEEGIRNWLLQNDKLVIAGSVLDDYMWILASLAPQTEAWKIVTKNPKADHVVGELSNRRKDLSEYRTVVITNDLISDHRQHFSTIKLASRWADNCVVNYKFPPFQKGISHNKRITFSPNAYFSREIQCNVDKTGTKTWHFPIAGRYDKWLCIRLPTKYSISKKRILD